MQPKNLAKLAFAVIVCQLAGVIGSLFTFPSLATWYVGIQKPEFNPPNWLFGPVWTLLFALMGISLYLVWQKRAEKGAKRAATFVFGMQLALNALWSLLFFGLRSPMLAFAEILALWLAIAATIKLFHSISKSAALLLLPYLLWVSFAAALNFSIWMLNP